MNGDDDFTDMFSMSGAYRDDDGIEIGSNDVLQERSAAQAPAVVRPQRSLPDARSLWIVVLVGLFLAATVILSLR